MSLQTRTIVIICLWLAFMLRVWGLDFGLPYEFHPDEHQYVDAALSWYTTGQMEARFANPPLFTYVLVVAFGLWFALTSFLPSPESITSAYVFARLWSVIFGVVTVALIYPVTKRLYNRIAGILAVVIMTGLFLPARESHFAVNDATVTFFALLVIYFSLIIFQHKHWLTYVVAGVAIGLATAAKLTGGLVVLSLLAAHGFGSIQSTGSSFKALFLKKEQRRLWLGLLVALVTFSTVSAPMVLQLPRFINRFNELIEFGVQGFGGIRMGPATGWEFYLDVLGWGIGWTMVLAVAISLGSVLLGREPKGIIVSIFSVALFGYMGAQKAFSARYLLPAIPPLVTLVAVGLARFEARWTILRPYQVFFWPLMTVILLAQPVANLIWFDHLLTLPDTRQLATAWFVNEFPEDTVVAREEYTVLPEFAFLDYRWPYKTIFLDKLDPTRTDADYYASHKTQVVAISNFIYERVRQDPAAEEARQRQLTFLDENASLIKTFTPYRQPDYDDWFYLDQLYGPAGETWQRVSPGPVIKIYRLPYESQPYRSDVPEISAPVNANFDGKLMLLGYDLPVRRAEPGGAFSLTLYWQALTRMNETYVIFNRLLDSQQRSWGGYDRWPQETANTILWRAGEVVVDTFNLPVTADAPDGIYTIDIGLYDQADPSASPLPILQEDGRPVGYNSIRIGPVKVGGPPMNVVLSPEEVAPQTPLSIEFGDPAVILLRGYDMAQKRNTIHLTFYWASLAQTSIDWSAFVHLRNEVGKIVAQKDGPVASGLYPTSLWDVGEIISDSVSFPIPPELDEEEYTLVVGLYRLDTGERLPVSASADNSLQLIKIRPNQ